MDVITQRLDRLNVNAVNAYPPSPTCDGSGYFDHLTMNCQDRNPLNPSSSDQIAYVNNF